MGMLPYVTGYRAGFKAAKAADGPGGSGYDAAYRTGMQVWPRKPKQLILLNLTACQIPGGHVGGPEQVELFGQVTYMIVLSQFFHYSILT